jgi:hypothetical protein
MSSTLTVPSGIFDKHSILSVWLPALISTIIYWLFLVLTLGPTQSLQLWANAGEDLKVLLVILFLSGLLIQATFSGVMLLVMSQAPGSLFLKEEAGRFTAFVTYLSHFENYTYRRYGASLGAIWPHIQLLLSSDNRQQMEASLVSFMMSSHLYRVLRSALHLLAPLFCGLLLHAFIALPHGRWWVWLLLIATSILYFGSVYFSFLTLLPLWFELLFGFVRIFVMPAGVVWFFVLMAAGWLLGQLTLTWPSAKTSLLFLFKYAPWTIHWERALACWVMLATIGACAAMLHFWMQTSGMSFGYLVQALFDIKRKDLAESLSFDQDLLDGSSEREFWRRKVRFLQSGATLEYPEDSFWKPEGTTPSLDDRIKRNREAKTTKAPLREYPRSQLKNLSKKRRKVLLRRFWRDTRTSWEIHFDAFIWYVKKPPSDW